MTPRISKAIDIFLDALNNGTLAKGTCKACACGNLVADAIGITPIIDKNLDDYYQFNSENEHWKRAFCVGFKSVTEAEVKEGIAQIHKTDFTIDEFIQIEDAFEKNTKIPFFKYSDVTREEILADQTKGLEAVVAVMLSFDDCKDIVQDVFTNKINKELICTENC